MMRSSWEEEEEEEEEEENTLLFSSIFIGYSLNQFTFIFSSSARIASSLTSSSAEIGILFS